ncbi:hypothetical protein GCM10009621_16300 [Corynebacterium felinum]
MTENEWWKSNVTRKAKQELKSSFDGGEESTKAHPRLKVRREKYEVLEQRERADTCCNRNR